MPRVTIGLPVRNGGDELPAAIDSLLAQTFTDFVIVASDNESTDDTLAVLDRYARGDSRLRVVAQASNIGAIPNFKATLERADTELFCWAAHDDRYHEDYLRDLVAAFDANPGAVAAGGRVRTVDVASPLRYESPFPFTGRSDAWFKSAWMHTFGQGGFIDLHFALFRTEVARHAYLPGPLVGGSDWLFVLGVLLAGPVVIVDRVLMEKAIDTTTPSWAAHVGEPGNPGASRAAWLATASRGTAYLLRQPLPLGRRAAVVPLMARFTSWLVWIELQRLAYDLSTKVLGEHGRKRLATLFRR